jgi:hypothetical protein
VKTLVLLCGRSFSGKSTLAGRLVGRGTAVVSFDSINLERGLRGGEGLPVEEWARTLDLAKQRTGALLESNERVVIDDTLCFRWMRDAFRALADAAGARTLLLYLDPPPEVLVQRMLANEAHQRRPGIAPGVLEAHLTSFEAPAEDERPIVLRSPAEIATWLEGAPR